MPEGIESIRELGVGETDLAHPALAELRPHYAELERFVEYVDGTLRPQGYRIVGTFDADRETAVAVAGFRIADCLAWGRHIYVDDLSTLPAARRRGQARALMEWLREECRRSGCGQLHLDSAVGPARFDAHRFYHAIGMSIHAHHFALEP